MHKYNNQKNNLPQPNLFEGMRTNDLDRLVSNRFTVDQYKSKMGNDADIVVLAFKVDDKFPAIDLMEFIEKGYSYVLDADISTGEEKDGKYRVFVELERDEKVPEHVEHLLRGIGQLCNCTNWRFKFFKDIDSYEFDKETFLKVVPLTKETYLARTNEQKAVEVRDVLDQGPAEIVSVDESNTLTFRKPYTTDFTVKLEAVGDYIKLVESLQGAIQLDTASNGQTLFLEKYLGNYVVHKIDNKFLIKNGNKAVIISKKEW
jgi:hypothetical protein